MTRLFTLLFLVYGLMLPVIAQPSTMPTDPPADNLLQHFLNGLVSFSAGFEQTLFNEFDEPLETASGSVYLQRPGRFHWAYTQPYKQYLISDATDLWVYDEDLEQVTVSAIDESIDKSPASVLAGDSDLGDDYLINDLGNLDGANWLELAPADPESQYNSIRLGFDGEQLTGMVLFDNLGQTTRIVFSNGKRNEPLDPALFRFSPPEGVDLIDNRDVTDPPD